MSIRDRLRVLANDFEPVPHELLRKYIAYARKYCHPRLSPAAVEILRSFYLKLRSQHRSPDTTPITTRQLESLIRLAEARARSELREVATAEDAEDVVDIMRASLLDAYQDSTGGIDFGRSQHGTGMSKRGEVKRYIAELTRMTEESSNSLYTYQQLYQIGRSTRLQLCSVIPQD